MIKIKLDKQTMWPISLILFGILLSIIAAYLYLPSGDEYHHLSAVLITAQEKSQPTELYGPCGVNLGYYPPFWNSLLAPFILLSTQPITRIYTLKIIQILSGTLLIPVTYLILKNLTKDKRIIALSTIFISLYIGRIIYSSRFFIDILLSLFLALTFLSYIKWRNKSNLKNSILLFSFIFISSMTHTHGALIFPLIFFFSILDKKLKKAIPILILAALIPLLWYIFENPFLKDPAIAKAVISSRKNLIGKLLILPEHSFYGLWLGGPNYEEPMFRGIYFSALNETFGFNIQIVWIVLAMLLTLVFLRGLISLRNKHIIIWLLLFFIAFYIKGLFRFFQVPSLVFLSYTFALGWSKFKKLNLLIAILVLIFAMQSLIFAYGSFLDKKDFYPIFEEARKIIPENAAVLTRYGSRNKFELDRNSINWGNGTGCINTTDLHDVYIYLDKHMATLNRTDEATLNLFRSFPNSVLVKRMEYRNEWAEIYYVK